MDVKIKFKKMHELHKITIDLLFCLIISFLIIQASNSAKQNQSVSNLISIESARISAGYFGSD